MHTTDSNTKHTFLLLIRLRIDEFLKGLPTSLAGDFNDLLHAFPGDFFNLFDIRIPVFTALTPSENLMSPSKPEYYQLLT